MDALLIAVIGIGGTLLGVLISGWLEERRESSRQLREDIVWRRQHALASASELLVAADVEHVLARTLVDLDRAITAAQEASRPVQEIHSLRQQVENERANERRALEQANDALSRLSLLLGQEAFLAASSYTEAVAMRPHDPKNALSKAALVDLLRADLGLPPRQIDPAHAMSGEEAIQHIRAERERITREWRQGR